MTNFFSALLAAWEAAVDEWKLIRYLQKGGNPASYFTED